MATSSFAVDHVVSPTGTDSGAGPWKTLQYATTHVAPGDTVVVEDGTYAGFVMRTSGTAAARIVFRARNKGGAKITTAAAGGGFPNDLVVIESASFFTMDGFDVSGAARAGISVLGNNDDGSDATDDVIQNCTSHDNGAGVTAGRHDGIFTGFARNVVIQDNVVHHNSEHGIYVSNAADGPSILRNLVHTNLANGIQINADVSTGGDGIITNWHIERNVVHDIGGAAGINLDGAQSGFLMSNLVYNCAKGGITLFQGDAAAASTKNVVANNTVYNPNGSRAAIQIADGANDNVVFNNIFYAGSSAGMEVQTVTGLVHDYNLVSRFTGTQAGAHESSPAAAGIFANAGAADFSLTTASPAVDHGVATLAGKAAPTLTVDGRGRPVGVDDIGCYELGAAPVGDAGGGGGGGGGAGGGGGGGGAGDDAGGDGGGNPANGGGGSSGGCGCVTATESGPSAPFAALAFVVAALLLRRRRG